MADPVEDEIDWYCLNDECGNMTILPRGKEPGLCPWCGNEMEPDEESSCPPTPTP